MVRKDAQAILVKDGRRLVVAFRGTTNASDVLDVMDTRLATMTLVNGTTCRVHRGFYDQMMSIEQDITRDMRAVLSTADVDHVQFTGHSMGAAMAMLAMAHYTTNNILSPSATSCDSFGSPQFADAAFFSHAMRGADCACIHMMDDVVPLMPMHPRFVYTDGALELTREGVASCNRDARLQHRRSTCPEFAQRLIKNGSLAQLVDTHSIMAYANALMALYRATVFSGVMRKRCHTRNHQHAHPSSLHAGPPGERR